MKNKNKIRTTDVNTRKITEFLSSSQDRVSFIDASKPQDPAPKPAKQGSKTKIKPYTLSKLRKCEGGKPVGEDSENEREITQPSKGHVRRTTIGQM